MAMVPLVDYPKPLMSMRSHVRRKCVREMSRSAMRNARIRRQIREIVVTEYFHLVLRLPALKAGIEKFS